MLISLAILGAAFVFAILLFTFFKSPKEMMQARELEFMKLQYEILNGEAGVEGGEGGFGGGEELGGGDLGGGGLPDLGKPDFGGEELGGGGGGAPEIETFEPQTE